MVDTAVDPSDYDATVELSPEGLDIFDEKVREPNQKSPSQSGRASFSVLYWT
jgi:hypothetical protein